MPLGRRLLDPGASDLQLGFRASAREPGDQTVSRPYVQKSGHQSEGKRGEILLQAFMYFNLIFLSGHQPPPIRRHSGDGRGQHCQAENRPDEEISFRLLEEQSGLVIWSL